MANDTHGRMTGNGSRRALNYIQDLLRGRKQAVTFYMDGECIRELGTGKEIEVIYPQKNVCSN